ncbi:Non-catalytic module family DOC2 [Piromyces sp. E2]|nr:Non-catalytic module family DOC2 [Piromyces sp. E2]|eukprot:OUM68846.1 Non-catalytic module family DOC2 [Piromyces sp. E2]
MKCDAIYLDKNYQYTINESLQFSYVCDFDQMDCPTVYMGDVAPAPIDNTNDHNNNNNEHLSTNTTTTISTESEPTNETTTNKIKCWAELINYPCCPEEVTGIYGHDEYGDWSYDFTKNEWCGLTPYESDSEETC